MIVPDFIHVVVLLNLCLFSSGAERRVRYSTICIRATESVLFEHQLHLISFTRVSGTTMRGIFQSLHVIMVDVVGIGVFFDHLIVVPVSIDTLRITISF